MSTTPNWITAILFLCLAASHAQDPRRETAQVTWKELRSAIGASITASCYYVDAACDTAGVLLAGTTSYPSGTQPRTPVGRFPQAELGQ